MTEFNNIEFSNIPADAISIKNAKLEKFEYLLSLPAEIRLMIYPWVFRLEKAHVEIYIDYVDGGMGIVELNEARTTHHGDALLYSCKLVCREAIEDYWKVVTVSALKPRYTIRPCMVVGRKMDPVDLGVLARGLPKIAVKNMTHLRNVGFLVIRGQYTRNEFDKNELPAQGPCTADYLREFTKLESVVFGDSIFNSQMFMKVSANQAIETKKHGPFMVYMPASDSNVAPKQWLKDEYGLNVDDKASQKIHFLRKALVRQVPENQELSAQQPLAECYLEFRTETVYAVHPGDISNDEEAWETLLDSKSSDLKAT